MRFLAKTMSYGLMHIVVTFCVGLFITGEIHLAVGISLLEPLVQIGFFSLHEYIWEKRNPGVPSPHKNCCSSSVNVFKLFKIKR